MAFSTSATRPGSSFRLYTDALTVVIVQKVLIQELPSVTSFMVSLFCLISLAWIPNPSQVMVRCPTFHYLPYHTLAIVMSGGDRPYDFSLQFYMVWNYPDNSEKNKSLIGTTIKIECLFCTWAYAWLQYRRHKSEPGGRRQKIMSLTSLPSAEICILHFSLIHKSMCWLCTTKITL